jgi:hypothetical protein
MGIEPMSEVWEGRNSQAKQCQCFLYAHEVEMVSAKDLQVSELIP